MWRNVLTKQDVFNMIAIWQTRRIYLMVVFTQLVSRNWQALKQRNFSNVERISSFRNLARKRKKFFAGKYIWVIWRNNAVKCFCQCLELPKQRRIPPTNKHRFTFVSKNGQETYQRRKPTPYMVGMFQRTRSLKLYANICRESGSYRIQTRWKD